jgi:non-ribosomal peptide synthetase component F
MRQHPSLTAGLQLRLAISSGEPLLAGLIAESQELLPPGCRVLNLYGSTEVAADCTAFDCTTWRPAASEVQPDHRQGKQQQQEQAQVPVGQPISNTLVAVLALEDAGVDSSRDDSRLPVTGQLQVQPLGKTGLVAVAGAGLAAGYLPSSSEARAATEQRFVSVPMQMLQQAIAAGAAVAAYAQLPASFWDARSTRMFITGDLGTLDASGCLHLEGRRDLQVKIAGEAAFYNKCHLLALFLQHLGSCRRNPSSSHTSQACYSSACA